MMLPGVELARKRRVHCHSGGETPAARRSPADPTDMRLPYLRPTAMDESAFAARIRLEEKLRGVAGPPLPAAAATTSSSSSSFSFSPRRRQREASDGKTKPKSGGLKRTGSRTELCAVCLEDFQSKQSVMRLPCSHKYHSDCLLPWLAAHAHCPCCRTPVPFFNCLS
ncbi:E3 ubiquitin-protein ligase RNF165-like [Phoenix dactylifera]|uniref:E3 ubiquitin-protein ligase RNF165-like n=1 Tax=Phoenix dactylifera TaxID=42345 RepID=A0A8B7BI66_PHODC|nr:E3 ubiquitin-protein ligase RNF165-like [Phoenix dactylifera]XP_038978389.1 E3 ubiquitin-protein ligase RNF165-like [Phoenix dactylifera]